jgi:hypothetical protein
VVIRQWLPRFFKYEFGKIRDPGEVQFIVGSVIRGRPNVIDKAKGAKMVFDPMHPVRPEASLVSLPALCRS